MWEADRKTVCSLLQFDTKKFRLPRPAALPGAINGKREFSKERIRRLAKRFHLSQELFY